MKTWEMLRDIREGETYEADPYYVVTCFNGGVRFGSVDGELAELSAYFLARSWRKRQQLVDFTTAFAAYEKGATIRPEKSSANYSPGTGCVFHPSDIREKWTIEGGAV